MIAQVVQHATLEDFRNNAEERYWTIVLNEGFVTFLENWYDVSQFPFFW
jgi:hypothetical protein